MIKSKLLKDARDLPIDQRVALIRKCKSMSSMEAVTFLYPRLFLMTPSDGTVEPVQESLSYMHLDYKGVYILGVCFYIGNIHMHVFLCHCALENGMNAYIWIGSQVSSDTLQALFGVSSVEQIPAYMVKST